MTRSCVKNLRHISFWNPQINFYFSHSQSLISHDCSPYMFNTLSCSACCRPSRTWIIFNRFLTIFEAFVPHFYLYCTHCIVPESLLSHVNTFHGGMVKLNAKFDADLLLYLLSHFECDGHTVHMLTQRHLLPHWLVQWSCHCSWMGIPVHSPWLPGYISVMQTILIISIVEGLLWTDFVFHIFKINPQRRCSIY